MLFLKENYSSEEKDKNSIVLEYQTQKDKINELTNETVRLQIMVETLTMKEREYEKLKEEVDSKSARTEQKTKELKNSIGELKREIAAKSNKEEEYKYRIRELEKSIHEKETDLEERSRHEGLDEREKN